MTEVKVPETDDWTPSGHRVLNRYHLTVDFNNRGHITKLNQWRHQIISRNFAPTTKMRAYWLICEREQVMAAIYGELSKGTTIHWNKITNAFNDRNHGTIQPAGSELLNPGKRGGTTACPREAPWRTRASIEHAAYKWAEYKELLNHKRAQWGNSSQVDYDEAEVSGDEDEVADPRPQPMTLEEAQNRRKASAKAGREKKKATKGTKVTHDEPTNMDNRKRKVEDLSDLDSTDDEFGPVGNHFEAPPSAKKLKTSDATPALTPASVVSSAHSESFVQDGPSMTASPISAVATKQATRQQAKVDTPPLPDVTVHTTSPSSHTLIQANTPTETADATKKLFTRALISEFENAELA